MKSPHILLYALLLLCVPIQAQDTFSLMAWNVENAFDTLHTEGKQDEEFLPNGSHRWSRYRFFRKLREISKTIVAADSLKPFDIVGLCEVENDTVLTYLTQHTQLRRLGYRYIITHNNDPRGINVALIYAPMRFRLIHHESIRPETRDPVRDILHATGLMPTGDTLDIYLLHLPSRLGGTAAARNRKAAIQQLLQNADSVSQARQQPHIVIMGDFNDELTGKRLKPFSLRGFKDVIKGTHPGTYKYQGNWSTLDHILIKSDRIQTESGIANLPFLLEPDKTNGGTKPFRTFLGPRYNGGISDHLPVWTKMVMNKVS